MSRLARRSASHSLLALMYHFPWMYIRTPFFYLSAIPYHRKFLRGKGPLTQSISKLKIGGEVNRECVVCINAHSLTIRFDRCLGTGNNGEVYAARLENVNEPICVKLFFKQQAHVETVIKEASLRTTLNDSQATPWCYGVVPLGEDANFCFIGIVLEIIDSRLKPNHTLTLRQLLESGQEFPAPDPSDLKKKLHHRIMSVHRCGVLINNISSDSIMLRWEMDSYWPYFIKMGQAIFSSDDRHMTIDHSNAMFDSDLTQVEIVCQTIELQSLCSKLKVGDEPGCIAAIAPKCLFADDLNLTINRNSKVGRGIFATVYVANLKGVTGNVCIKLFPKLRTCEAEHNTIVGILKEAALLRTVYDTGATPKCYGVVVVNERSYFWIGIVQEMITSKTDSSRLTLAELWEKPDRKKYWSYLRKQILAFLTDIHLHGVLHGDIHLGNISLQWDGDFYRPYFIDFGKAKYGKNKSKDFFESDHSDFKCLEYLFGGNQ